MTPGPIDAGGAGGAAGSGSGGGAGGEPREAPRALPARPPAGHKGTFGAVLIVAGRDDEHAVMVGAPALAARAALRAGCGLARVIATAPALRSILAIEPSATGLVIPSGRDGSPLAHEGARVFDDALRGAGCVLVGPGLGLSPGAQALALRCVQQEDAPVVVDADAITLLARVPELTRDLRAACVLTPHPGEFRTLAGALGITSDPADPLSREPAALSLAQRLGCVVVLKGARTVVTDGHRAWTCPRVCPALATAGTGDVLAGLIASLLAQCARPSAAAPDLRALAAQRFGLPVPAAPAALSLYDLACIGVDAHAEAGEAWSRQQSASGGLLARELADLLPALLERRRTQHP